MHLVESWGINLLAGKLSISFKVDVRTGQGQSLGKWPAVWAPAGLQEGEMAGQKGALVTPQGTASREAESESTTWPRRSKEDRKGSPSAHGSSLECSIHKWTSSVLGRGSPAVKRGTDERCLGALTGWLPLLHCDRSPRGESQSQYPRSHSRRQACCYLCRQNLIAGEEVIKKWVTAEGSADSGSGSLSPRSGFREGFCDPWEHTPSGILGEGRERVVVWALASGGGKRETGGRQSKSDRTVEITTGRSSVPGRGCFRTGSRHLQES